MNISVKNGSLQIGGIVMYNNQNWEELNFIIAQKGYEGILQTENPPYTNYSVSAVLDEDGIFNLQVGLKSNKLVSVFISFDTNDCSLSEFIDNSLENAKSKTFFLIKKIIGADRYKGEWGQIEYFFDPRSVSVGISINYF